MASTYTPLGIELQATGENAGTWGTKTNTNLSIFEQIVGAIISKVGNQEGRLYETILECFFELNPNITTVSHSHFVSFLGSLNIPVHDGDAKVFFEVVSRSGRVDVTVEEIARVVCGFQNSRDTEKPFNSPAVSRSSLVNNNYYLIITPL